MAAECRPTKRKGRIWDLAFWSIWSGLVTGLSGLPGDVDVVVVPRQQTEQHSGEAGRRRAIGHDEAQWADQHINLI